MKRVLAFILIWTFLVVTGTIVSANSQTRHRHRSQLTELSNRTNGGKLNVIR
jgi:hypothetical protein